MKPYYQDDSVTIYHGDCREILPSLGPVDLVLTDPPYNVGLDYADGDARADYIEWSTEWFNLSPRPLIFTPGNVNLGMWMRIQEPQWVCCWFKANQASPSSLGGFSVWEPILVYGKLLNRVGQDGWYNLVSFQERKNGAGNHPAPKTLSLWKKLVEVFTDPHYVILDPFMGSGTTLRAAKDLGRKAIGTEIEEKYCEIAAKRMSQSVMELSNL